MHFIAFFISDRRTEQPWQGVNATRAQATWVMDAKVQQINQNFQGSDNTRCTVVCEVRKAVWACKPAVGAWQDMHA
eukprot:222001-Pelagomonas_calceolata.AAC.1